MRTDAATVLRQTLEFADTTGRTVLGIVGPPGVGKTYVASRVLAFCESSGVSAETLSMDGFHLSNFQLKRLGLHGRKGAPETFDVEGFIALLSRIRRAEETLIFAPDYDRSFHEPVAARRCVEPDTRVVIVEGNYLLHRALGWSNVANLLDIVWYLDAPEQVRFDRLLERQMASGKSVEDARSWVNRVDRENADLVSVGRDRATFVTDATLVDLELGQLR